MALVGSSGLGVSEEVVVIGRLNWGWNIRRGLQVAAGCHIEDAVSFHWGLSTRLPEYPHTKE